MTDFLFEINPVPVNGERIRQARELRSLTQSGLAELLGVDQTMVSHLERGVKQPNGELLQAIATVLRMPTAFFRQPAPPDLPQGTLLFRAKAGLGKRPIAQAHAYAQIAFEIGWRLRKSATPIPVRLPSFSDPIEAARSVRGLMQNDGGPLVNLVRNIERLGVWVLPIPEASGCEAFAVWAGPEREIPVIGMVRGRSGDRLRMSVAHELGHLILHRDLTAGAGPLEEQAYKFAAELLLPANSIIADLRQDKINLFRLAQLKTKWQVSMQAIARRSHELQLLSDRQYRYLMQQISSRGWRIEEPEFVSIPVDKPRAIRKMLEVVYASELDPAQVGKEFGLSGDFVDEIMSAFALAPGHKLNTPQKNATDNVTVLAAPERKAL